VPGPARPGMVRLTAEHAEMPVPVTCLGHRVSQREAGWRGWSAVWCAS
jgi:hypothetical protein